MRSSWSIALLPLATFVVACAGSPTMGWVNGPGWITFSKHVSNARAPSDLLRSFEAHAQGYGCSTDRHYVNNPKPVWTAVAAYCRDGGVISFSVSAAHDESATIGCKRPPNRPECEALLQRILTEDE